MSVLTVSQLNKLLAFKIKQELKFKGAAVKGEIADLRIHYKTGHAFFSVKDESSSIRCVMFAGRVKKQKAMPSDGMSVLVMGDVEVYERDGSCQLIATEIAVTGGAGAVSAKNELVKERLKKLGVFEEKRKKQIPIVPKKIAVVTSMTGAALQDILNVTGRRYPLCTVEIYHATVQGDSAPPSICAALRAADSSGADTILMSRGGGSSEDLIAFNDEQVVMAVAECNTPIISAVGHETDTTLADYAADMRAPTPSAAAELATPDIAEMFSAIRLMSARLDGAVNSYLQRRAAERERLGERLKAASPERRLAGSERRLAQREEKLKLLMENKLKLLELRLEKSEASLNGLSPFNVLGRGYALVQREGGAVTSAAELKAGDRVSIRFADGAAEAEISGIDPRE